MAAKKTVKTQETTPEVKEAQKVKTAKNAKDAKNLPVTDGITDSSEYGNNSITSLKGADRVRKRPAVIFGSDGLEGRLPQRG